MSVSESAAPSMKPQTAKQVARLESLLRQTQVVLKELGSWSNSASGELTDAEVKSFRKLDTDLAVTLEQISPTAARAKQVLDAQTTNYRFNEDQKAVLGRLAGGDEVLWMQSGTALDSLAKRGLVRVAHDAKQRVIAVLTEAGREVVKDWKE